MKVAVTAQGPGLEAEVDSRFGRCTYFVIKEMVTGEVETVANEPGTSGAGIEAAQLLARAGVEAVITGHLGPKAGRALAAAGIAAYQHTGGTVAGAFAALEAGELAPIGNPV
ncbi:MAG: NifB/NifX family molybdenum-iron cluster-binding protein [bacterium]|nr:NifB/NifX family molybdenum-iron cluster-binding protein [Bacillota bacterium]HHW54936.1 dinitrogenase iron-molybdenum cofactor biosynthesis protein [Bacillota bacterium]